MEPTNYIDQEKYAAAMQAQAVVNPVLARMVQLAVSALKAESFEKAAKIIVNQVHTLIKTDRAVLVPLFGRKRILFVSGDLEPSQDNQFAQAVDEIRKPLRNDEEPRLLSIDSLPSDMDAPNALKAFQAMGGTNVLWMPLPAPGDANRQYALWLERWNNRQWSPEEVKLLSHAAVFFGSALGAPRKRGGKKPGRKKRIALMLLIVFILLMWLPVNSSVTAPVQVVPDHPYYVFAPFDGIIETLSVQPGQKVKKGDLIFRYDTRVLEKRLEEAQRGGVAVAIAELARLEGAAYTDEEARAKIPVQKLEVERRESEVEFLRKQLELSEVRTDSDGVVVLDDPDSLIGASIQTGQLVLSVADPESTKLKIMVPVTDVGLLKQGASAAIRLDSDPLRMIQGEVTRIGFDVRMSDEYVPSVLLEAEWKDDVRVSPGQRGVAKIQGPEVYLGLQIFRKPLMKLRTFFGI